MPDVNLPSVLEHLTDPEPYLLVGGLTVAVAGAIVGAFTLYVLLLLPFALAKGELGRNARAVLRDLLGLFHALLEVIKHRGGRR